MFLSDKKSIIYDNFQLSTRVSSSCLFRRIFHYNFFFIISFGLYVLFSIHVYISKSYLNLLIKTLLSKSQSVHLSNKAPSIDGKTRLENLSSQLHTIHITV